MGVLRSSACTEARVRAIITSRDWSQSFRPSALWSSTTRSVVATRATHRQTNEVYRTLWGPNEWTPAGPLSEWDVRDRLHELDLPTLITAGRYDLCTPLILQELQEGLPHSRTVVFGASSHMPYLEEAGPYADELSRFLSGAEADGTRPPPL